MKNLKLASFEIYLLKEALKYYKSLVEKEEFAKNSFVTKNYVMNMISQLEEKLDAITEKEKNQRPK
jgi:hypothetical protein